MKKRPLLQKVLSKRPLYAQLLFTAIAFLAMAVLSYKLTKMIVYDHLIRNTEAVLSFQRASLEDSLMEFRTPLEIASGTIRDMILRGEDSESVKTYLDNISEYFSSNEKYRLIFDGLAGYFETLADGPAFINSFDWKQIYYYKPADQPWYMAAIAANGEIAETMMYEGVSIEEAVLVYSLCIFNDEGQRLGVISLRIMVNAIGKELVETALAQGGYGMLLSNDLVVLAHPNNDFVGKPLKDLAVPLSDFEEDLKNKIEISEQPVITYKNENAVAFFRNLSNGWYLGLVTPSSPYYRSVTNMMIFLSALGITLAAALILILIRIDAARSKSDLESKYKSAFLANMSHEIRTPMNAIIGMTTIGKSASDSERKDYCFTKIEDASNHLLGVINDILDMSKIEANKFELSPVEFNFEKTLQKAANVVNFRIDEKHQKFTVHIDKAIPKTMIGDDQRIAQVITNLLGNAVKFTPEKGLISLNACFMGEADGVYTIQIAVKDSGIGISPEQQKHLFTSFEQAESSTTRKFGGTGLGLAISKNIVEMMGGNIWVQSEPGKGAVFSFTIQTKRGVEKRQEYNFNSLSRSSIRIMAVDDDPDILTYFSEVAHEIGVFCDTAISGEDALKKIKENGVYHIYFVDWKMPGMDGIQLARELKTQLSADSIVLMISAAEWNSIAQEAKEAGVDKFLSKPLFPSSIADIISESLGINQQMEEVQKDITDIFAGSRILLVEDVEINREIVMALIEPAKLEVECAENGARAVQMFNQSPQRYDMIFMDVQMPEMDGYEATRRIRSIEEIINAQIKTGFPEGKAKSNNGNLHVPIIAMTANVFREDIEKCLEAGMDSHLGKPLDFNEFLAALKLYLH
jgi:signal transduction histidine kinase/DNA-binding response OmpR family regulator